jgi:predicted DNA-binding protein (MmcQ/YjbR family)
MDIEKFRNHCLSKKGVTEEFPFDNKTLVFKVMGKIFALADIEDFVGINLKCDPEIAVELRERYPAVLPGYHMNKKHWNTILMDGSIPEKYIWNWIDDSYDLVSASLTKKQKEELAEY